MTRQLTSIGPVKTWLSLENEQNCEEKSVDVSASTPRSFRTNPMSTNTPHRKRDFGSTVRITALHGYRGINEVVA